MAPALLPASELDHDVSVLVGRALAHPLLRQAVADAVAAPAADRLLAVTLPVESVDPLALLESHGDAEGFRYYWEHPAEDLALAAGGETVRLRTHQADRFNWVSRQMDRWNDRSVRFTAFPHSLAGPHWLGGFSFQDRPQAHQWRAFGTACFVLPEWMVVREGHLTLLTVAFRVDADDTVDTLNRRLGDRFTSIVEAIRRMDSPAAHVPEGSAFVDEDALWTKGETAFRHAVARATNEIRDNGYRKVVLAREVLIPLNRAIDSTRVLNVLRAEYPTCYTFLFQLNRSAAFLGSTPERLAGFQAAFIKTEGLAGSIARGRTATSDAQLEKQLLSSDKDLGEHRLVVDAIRERLHRYTPNVRIQAEPGVRKYPNVQHLHTPITAEIPSDLSPLSVLEALHPTPAVGGYPMETVLPRIQELEGIDRGWYAGPVGWFNTNGRGEFAVAIRSGLIESHQARLFAGCGIVADSDPESEWKETLLKLIPMRSALRHG